jgi:CAAX prenyl protease-like protein
MNAAPEVDSGLALYGSTFPGKILSQVRLWGRQTADTLSLNRLLGRLVLLAAILAAEVFPLAATPHFFHLLGPFAPFGIASYAVFLGLGYSEFKAQRQPLPFGVGFFFLHLGSLLAILLTANASLHGIGLPAASMAAHVIPRLLLLFGIAFLALACVPLGTWVGVLRKTGLLWLYAALGGALALSLRYPLQSFWDASRSAPVRLLQIATFHSVKAVLLPILPAIYVNPDTFVIGTQRFSVFIAEECSGLEGLGLVLVFTTIWLCYFRKESRFPQALLLIPCALASVWILNILRISALVLIGNAGYGEIAMIGFHSQAGWIAFTLVAFTFSTATRTIAWVRKGPEHALEPSHTSSRNVPGQFVSGVVPSIPDAADRGVIQPSIVESGESPATGAYLVPFLAILAASFLSKAASGHFESLYPLRFLAALIALWHYRRELRQIDWRFGWLAPVVGAAVFAVWIVPTFRAGNTGAGELGNALSALTPAARWSWIAFRVAAAAITVPIAEELAFRGYLARRLVDREFDAVPFSAVTVLSIGVSSVVFGLMHGRHWLAGILAGLAYAGVMKWKGRLGDAIAAHATSNILLAVWVLGRGDWGQW